MRLTRRLLIQLAIFGVVALTAGTVMAVDYMRLPAKLFGIGQYTVTVELARAGGLYENGNVTYRGTEVGRVTEVQLTDTGVAAVLSLRSDITIPADIDAEVHSVSGVGEQYVALQPRDTGGRPLEEGDVIPEKNTSVPPDINSLLDATNRGLQAIPGNNLKTVVDESYTAVGGLGPEIARIVKGSTQLSIDARKNLDSITKLIDQGGPVLDTQTDTFDSIAAWAAHIADITKQLQTSDTSVAALINQGAPAAAQAQQLIERLRPSLPVLLANLVNVNPVAITYQPALEQLLVLLPQAVQQVQAINVANKDNQHAGVFTDFNLNLNLPQPCTTGFLPAQQQRSASFEDVPDLPEGLLYCRVPQDSPHLAVRGARNIPCLNRPGKRAPSARMCESDEEYVPLNDGYNWKGDPNATLSGQGVPQPDSAPVAAAGPAPTQPPPPIAVATYDPATGSYVGPDGHVYTQGDLGAGAEEKTWQSMLTPPK